MPSLLFKVYYNLFHSHQSLTELLLCCRIVHRCSVCHIHHSVLSSYHQKFNQSNKTDSTRGAGTTYVSGAPSNPLLGFSEIHVLVLCMLLVTLLISSNFIFTRLHVLISFNI